MFSDRELGAPDLRLTRLRPRRDRRSRGNRPGCGCRAASQQRTSARRLSVEGQRIECGFRALEPVPQDWPGVHAVHALLTGEPLEGYWFDRTQEYAAGRRRETYDRLRYATREVLALDPLPCWRHLSPEERRKRAASLVAEIEAQAVVHREQTGIQPLGAAAILAQDPLSRPHHVKRSPAPLFHAASKAVRRELYDAYRLFVAAFRDAAKLLRQGNRTAVFPLGSFPPALPFVGG